MIFSLITTHRDFRKVLMGQASKRSLTWLTSGRLRWGEREWIYKGRDSLIEGGLDLKKTEKRERQREEL